MEERAGVLGRLKEEDALFLACDIVAEGAVAGSDQVGVGVDQAGEDRRLAVVPAGARSAIRRLDLCRTADPRNPITVDQESGRLPRAATGPVEETRRGDRAGGPTGDLGVRDTGAAGPDSDQAAGI